MRRLLEDAAHRAAEYLESLPERRVAPEPAAVRRLSALDVPLQEGPLDAPRVLAELDELVSPATMAMAGPRFFGFVIGGSLPAALAANWLAAAWDQNAGMYSVTPGVAHLEQVVMRWLEDLFALPGGTAAAFATGATMANFTALAAARHAVLQRAGWNVQAEGLFGAPPVTVVVGEEVHVTVLKALGMLGLGRSRVVRVPADEQGRMRASESTARSACGRKLRRATRISCAAWSSPTRGPRTRTSGSTCRTTAASRSSARRSARGRHGDSGGLHPGRQRRAQSVRLHARVLAPRVARF